MPSDCKKGSEWRKWDLHIHTPFTKLNNRGFTLSDSDNLSSVSEDDKKWEKFFKCIQNEELFVVALTDYYSIESYSKAIEKTSQFGLTGFTLLPNIEFRIAQQNKDNEFINIHVIFSNSDSVVRKINPFLARLPLVSTDDLSLRNKYCTPEDLQEIGYERAIIKFDKFCEQLLADFSPITDYIIVGVARGLGNIRPGIDDDGRAGEYAKEIDKKCHIFYGSIDDIPFYLNDIDGRTTYNLPPKAVVFCSDAHEFLSAGNEKFTWIKADPTFEGLTQILYEPKERVKIQVDNPAFEFDKPYFKEINIENKIPIFEDSTNQVYFTKTNLPLSSNLVSIIGGRGTGKSILIDYLANSFSNTDAEYSQQKDEYVLNNDFNSHYSKNNQLQSDVDIYTCEEGNILDFIYIPQTKLKRVSDKKNISTEIKILLGIKDLQFDDRKSDEINQIITDIESLKTWFLKEDENGTRINNRIVAEKKESDNKKLLSSIKTTGNKEKLESYTDNVDKIRDIEQTIKSIEELEVEFNDSREFFKSKIDDLNSRSEISFKIPLIDYSNINDLLTKNTSKLEVDKKEKEDQNVTIKREFEKSGFTGDLASLLVNADSYQSNIKLAQKKIKEISAKEAELEDLTKKRSRVGVILKEEYVRQQSQINDRWENILTGIQEESHKKLVDQILKERDIKIEGQIYFDKNTFYKKLSEFLNMNHFKTIDKLKEAFKIEDADGIYNFISTDLFSYIEGDNNEKVKTSLDLSNLFFDIKIRKEYLYTEAITTYKNKPLDKLSVGQRGTVYLCLKLATDTFSKVIIFDQPEDDLDNEFIINELVDIFKEIKKYRQVIIVTHNANLVVNADSEQVIVAKNENEELSYISGSLENREIISSVCDILEGGEAAFLKRKNKYSING